MNRTRRALATRLRIDRADVASILRLIRSRLEISIRAAPAARGRLISDLQEVSLEVALANRRRPTAGRLGGDRSSRVLRILRIRNGLI